MESQFCARCACIDTSTFQYFRACLLWSHFDANSCFHFQEGIWCNGGSASHAGMQTYRIHGFWWVSYREVFKMVLLETHQLVFAHLGPANQCIPQGLDCSQLYWSEKRDYFCLQTLTRWEWDRHFLKASVTCFTSSTAAALFGKLKANKTPEPRGPYTCLQLRVLKSWLDPGRGARHPAGLSLCALSTSLVPLWF